MHKAEVPVCFHTMFTHNTHNYNTCFGHNLKASKHNTNIERETLKFMHTQLRMEIPLEIRNLHSNSIFKAYLNKHFLQSYDAFCPTTTVLFFLIMLSKFGTILSITVYLVTTCKHIGENSPDSDSDSIIYRFAGAPHILLIWVTVFIHP